MHTLFRALPLAGSVRDRAQCGYACGMGLIGMGAVAFALSAAVSQMPCIPVPLPPISARHRCIDGGDKWVYLQGLIGISTVRCRSR